MGSYVENPPSNRLETAKIIQKETAKQVAINEAD